MHIPGTKMTASYLPTHQPIIYESIAYVTQPLRSNYFTPKTPDLILFYYPLKCFSICFSFHSKVS